MSTFITIDTLNLRREPGLGNNIIFPMPPETIVEKIDEKSGWFQVRTLRANNVVIGFAFSQFLKQTTLPFPEPEPPLSNVPVVHLNPGSNVITRGGTGRAFPLNEPGLVKVDLRQIADPGERRVQIGRVLDFLDVERSLRYAPNTKNTFCNIYAYDVAFCLGAYIPRVWWTSGAIVRLVAGEQVKPVYDKTVTELNANRLADWFEQFGASFGWRFLTDPTILQQEANQGKLGVIVAQRVNQNFSGHIVAVPPETATQRATRNGNAVTIPLQSQAGARNRKYFANLNWWSDAKFKKFTFWVWE